MAMAPITDAGVAWYCLSRFFIACRVMVHFRPYLPNTVELIPTLGALSPPRRARPELGTRMPHRRLLSKANVSAHGNGSNY